VKDTFFAIPKLMERWIAIWINKIISKIDWFAQKVNNVFWTNYSFTYKVDVPEWWLFDSTKGKFKDLKNKMSILWKHQKKIYWDVKNNLKAWFNNFIRQMDASNNKISSSVKTTEQIQKDADNSKSKRIEEYYKKYWKGWWIIDKSNKKNSKSTNEVKNKLSELKNEYSKVESKIKKLDKISEKYAKNSKKYNSDIIDNVRKLNKELNNRKNLLATEIKNIESESKNKLANRYVTIKELVWLQKISLS